MFLLHCGDLISQYYGLERPVFILLKTLVLRLFSRTLHNYYGTYLPKNACNFFLTACCATCGLQLHTHRGDLSSLGGHADPEHLPADFGGLLPPMDAAQTVLRLFEHELAS